MNTQAIQNEINNIIEANHSKLGKFARKQHQIAKHQIATLTELGILELVPNAPYSQYIGHSDASAIIEAAQDSGKQVGGLTADGEGDYVTTSASKLYQLLNETEAEPDKIKVGDYVRVKPHTTYQYLSHGAVISPPKTHKHFGYKRAKVATIYADGYGPDDLMVEIEVAGGFDYVMLNDCEKV